MATFSKVVQKQIDELEDRILKLDREKDRLEKRIDDLKTVDSPIQAGDTIEWVQFRNEKTNITVMKRGQVVSLDSNYSGSYNYRCTVLNSKGLAVGFANVGENKIPTLIKKARAKKVLKKRAKR